MDCQAVFKLMNRYLDEEINLEEERVLEFHLERCHQCQKLFGELKSMHLLLNTLEPSHDFTTKIMGKINDTKENGSKWLARLQKSWIGVAIVILLLIFSLSIFRSPTTPELIISSGHVQTGVGLTGQQELIVKEGKITIRGLPGTVEAINSQIVLQKTSADLNLNIFEQMKDRLGQFYQQIKTFFRGDDNDENS